MRKASSLPLFSLLKQRGKVGKSTSKQNGKTKVILNQQPDIRSGALMIKAFVILGFKGWQNRTTSAHDTSDTSAVDDNTIYHLLLIYFNLISFILFLYEPSSQHSYGIHQSLGPCDEMEPNIFGSLRFKHWCLPVDQRDIVDFTLSERYGVLSSTEWYTVQGIPFGAKWMFVAVAVSGFGIAGVLLVGKILEAKQMKIADAKKNE